MSDKKFLVRHKRRVYKTRHSGRRVGAPHRPGGFMSTKKIGAFSLACLSAASIAVPVAYAQAAATAADQAGASSGDTLQEVVVSGLRESLNQATVIKRLSPQVVDSIV